MTKQRKIKNIEGVRKWRKRTKDIIIEAMGGGCAICGYKKCHTALHLHHLDSATKEFQFSKVKTNPASWSKIVKELRKCILVCGNCHGEIHEKLIIIPDNISKFNETYAEKITIEDKELLNNCPICKKQKPIFNNTCSYSCSTLFVNMKKDKCPICGKFKLKAKKTCSNACRIIYRRKVNRPLKESLLQDIQSIGYSGTGRKYGVSDNAIRKWEKSYSE